MKDEYIIINKSVLEKRIKELEKPIPHYDGIYVSDAQNAQIELIEEVLSQSTPLIPEIEKAYFEGECYGIGTDACITKQDYISNLKLDI